AERLKASSTYGRYGTLSHTLPKALPLDSAKGTLPLLKPNVWFSPFYYTTLPLNSLKKLVNFIRQSFRRRKFPANFLCIITEKI
ncbi:MAG: hypothetical protein NC093_04975, partial [Alistipes sp.]|nr:hypothetical protein [Alistipes sp.]